MRWYCADTFSTSRDSERISVIGHSRGAAGTLYLAVHHPDKFASALSVAYVSDYMISMLQPLPDAQLEKIRNSGIRIRMLIGSLDHFVVEMGRRGSYTMDEYFDSEGIPQQKKKTGPSNRELHI